MKIEIRPEELAPIIQEATRKAIEEYAAAQSKLPARCLSEDEAAEWLGVETHTLRDERRRGRIQASRIVGRRIRYLPEDLIGYVIGRREGGKDAN